MHTVPTFLSHKVAILELGIQVQTICERMIIEQTEERLENERISQNVPGGLWARPTSDAGDESAPRQVSED